ncbi:hypothetical protein GDO78_017533, partial [Eleutherodactylus coqui]
VVFLSVVASSCTADDCFINSPKSSVSFKLSLQMAECETDSESRPPLEEEISNTSLQESMKSDNLTVRFSVEELESHEERQKESCKGDITKIHQSPTLVGRTSSISL